MIMTYTTEIQTIEAFGVPYVETRYQPEVQETQLITIEFSPKACPLDDYGYRNPQIIFGDLVTPREQVDYCLFNSLNLAKEIDFYKVCAMELVEPKTESGQLAEAPYWLIGIRGQGKIRELIWFEENELIAKRDLFEDFEEF